MRETAGMNKHIEGKVIVITGASSGLGEATVRLLSAEGATVVLGTRRVDRLRSLANALTGKGGQALAVATDVTHCNEVKKLVYTAVQTFRRIRTDRGLKSAPSLLVGGERCGWRVAADPAL